MPIGAALAAAAPAIAGGVAASAAGALITGAIGGGGSSGAISDGQQQANRVSQQSIAQADGLRQSDRSLYDPIQQAGSTAGISGLNQYANILGLNGADAATAARSDFTASPGYDYQLQQGLRAVDSGAAAQGMLRSGATLKAEQTFGSNLANADFGNYINRLNSLSQLGLQTGLQATQGIAGTTATYNNLLAGQATNQEQIAGQAATQQAGIYGNLASNVAGTIKSVPWNSLLSSGDGTEFDASGSGGFGGAGTAAPANLTAGFGY